MPAFFYRLSARAQRCYLRSDSIDRFDFAPTPSAVALTADLAKALEAADTGVVESAARTLSAELCRIAGVKLVRIDVMGVRPHNARGELHGIFYLTPPQRIVLWMRTAKRHHVVKPRTFIRTLFHEFAHYLDYSLLRLDDSYHTRGFFKRESFLVRMTVQVGSVGDLAGSHD
ncbi:MAG TPA: hypothetical protein VIX59_20925 [Candidatus Binataceae bacterium]